MIETDDLLLARPHHSLSHSTADFAMPSHDASDDVPDRVIYPRSGWIRIDWKELYAYRELLGFLVLRDVSVRYKQTVLGSAWAIIQPVTMMVLFTLVFGQIAKIPTADVPYGRDLRLMDSVKDVSDLPREGKNLIVVTDINNVLHLRVFDSDGKMAVDTDEHKLTDKVQQVEELKQQLKRLPHPDELTGKEKDRLIIAVTSIVSRNLPYAVFVFAGLIPMTLFSQGFTKASASLALEEHLMSKVYFPRIMVPVAGIAVFLVDLVIAFGLYAVILLYYGIMPSWTVVFVPVLVAADLYCHDELRLDVIVSHGVLSRLPVLGAVYVADRLVLESGDLPVEHGPQSDNSLDHVAQSHVWHRSGLSVGHSRRPVGHPVPGDIHGDRARVLHVCRFLLPEDGASVRGFCIGQDRLVGESVES